MRRRHIYFLQRQGADIDDSKRDRADDFIRPGLFQVRLVQKGAFIPAIIYRPCPIDWVAGEPLDRWPHLRALRDVDMLGRWKETCDPYWLWLNGTEIDMGELQYWVRTRVHIMLHEPDAVDLDPRKPIDLSKGAPIGPRKR